jgi:FkbM family methyltransferase
VFFPLKKKHKNHLEFPIYTSSFLIIGKHAHHMTALLMASIISAAAADLLDFYGLRLTEAERGVWRSWRADADPLPAPHGRKCNTTHMRLRNIAPQRICVMEREQLISRFLRTRGHWFECDALVSMWQASAAAQSNGHGIFLEIGGNIGACTIQMLLSTNATIIVFEPNPVNLFYLTSSLSWLHADGRQGSGAVVFPLGLGNESLSTQIFEQDRNSGNSVIGARVEMARSTQHSVLVRRLDDLILPGSQPIVHLAKIDVQGYECKVLAGMRRFLAKHTIEALHIEVAIPHLEAQGCSELGLFSELWKAGYTVHKPTAGQGMTALAWPVHAPSSTMKRGSREARGG